MNPELQKCREYYDALPRQAKTFPTSVHLLKAIQIGEQLESSLSKIASGEIGEAQCRQEARLALLAATASTAATS
jgi:hypothetical protein